MRSIFTTHSVNLSGSKRSDGGQKDRNDHKSMVTLWLVVLFALWVVLTTALAVTARNSKSRKTLPPPVIGAVVVPVVFYPEFADENHDSQVHPFALPSHDASRSSIHDFLQSRTLRATARFE